MLDLLAVVVIPARQDESDHRHGEDAEHGDRQSLVAQEPHRIPFLAWMLCCECTLDAALVSGRPLPRTIGTSGYGGLRKWSPRAGPGRILALLASAAG